jgi:hypothetical protein
MSFIEFSFARRGSRPKYVEIEGDALGIVDMRQPAHRLERSHLKFRVGRARCRMTGVALQGGPAALPSIDILQPVAVALEKVDEFEAVGLPT